MWWYDRPVRGLLQLLALAVAAPALARDPASEAVLADLPFLDYPEPHRIVVDLAPEGASRALRFIVDTGASHSVATPRAAAALGIRVRRQKRDPYRRKTLLGRDVQIAVDTRYSDTASRTGWEYALLGGQFLAEYVVELDFRARRLRLLDPDRFEVPESVDAADEAVMPLVLRMNRPAVELLVNGRPTLAMIDTGAQPALILSGKSADTAGVPAGSAPRFQSGSAVGPMLSELRRVDELKLGSFTFTDLRAVVNPHGWYNQVTPGGSVVGYELLERFLVRIDYERRRVWLKRNPDAPSPTAGKPRADLDGAPPPAEPAASP